MNYVFDITTPANTARSSPTITRSRIGTGRVAKIWVYFPPGNAGLHHLKILHGNHQLWPTNPEGDFSGDNILIELPEDWDIPWKGWAINFRTWNTDDFFDHRVTFGMSILEEATPPRWLAKIIRALAGIGTGSRRSLLTTGGGVWSTIANLFKPKTK